MKKFIDTFHYLTQDLPDRTHIEQTEIACGQGAKWVQYRCLTKADDELLKDLSAIAEICDDWGTTLIVTNHYHLLDKADIQGVHIEDMDADLSAIRAIIGKDKTLGASANTLEQILNHVNNGADYIGCGPFGHTDTKPNEAQHWGIKGYQEAIQSLEKLNIHIPLIAAGGVALEDVKLLKNTGIHGVAASAAVNLSGNPALAYKAFYQLLH